MAADTDKQSFWEHLDVLRAAIVKSLLVAVVFGVAAFCFKEELFAVILAPKDVNFITYRLLYSLSGLVTEVGAQDFLVKLINTGLAEQFIIHMKTALCAGILCASPYILYQLFRFVSPALYVNERKYVMRVVGVEPNGMKIDEVVRVINNIASKYDLVGLTVAEPMPRIAIKLRNMLDRLPLLK